MQWIVELFKPPILDELFDIKNITNKKQNG